ncbi:MAG: hypothetical protein KIT54_07305 [Phycisphaeraceae bacterium]|nr:hypothetical protein [Phycisphaeraceae bacterium]
MSTVPTKLPEAISWVGVRLPVWVVAAPNIGLETSQVASLAALHASAQTLRAEYEALKAQTRAKGQEYRQVAGGMRSTAAGQVVQIRGFARTSPNPGAVFTEAQLPQPAEPTPSPPPGTPEAFKVELLQSGGLRFAFKCDHPSGVTAVTYRVMRQAAPQTPFEFLLNAKKRNFEDDTLTGQSNVVTYLVTAQTSTKDGNPAYFTVRFGAGNQATIIAQGPVEPGIKQVA